MKTHPQYHVACAGFLLGIAFSRPASFPVGKVDFLEIAPMTFTEFLMANGDGNFVSYMDSIEKIEPMPQSVCSWAQDRDVELIQQVLSNILGAYERDFAKHSDPKDLPKISLIWKSIPSQLARENKKFIYKAVKEGARAREYEDALQWLCDANLTYKIYRSTMPGLPVSAYDDLSSFKLYMVDVGLLRRLSLLAPSAFGEGNRLFVEFKGALSENYVLQALQDQFEATPRYWTMENPRCEIDFLILKRKRHLARGGQIRAQRGEPQFEKIQRKIRCEWKAPRQVFPGQPAPGRRPAEHPVISGRSRGSADRDGAGAVKIEVFSSTLPLIAGSPPTNSTN